MKTHPKTIAFIQARMNSRRLRGKVLMKVGAEVLLGMLIRRLSLAKTLDDIVVITSGSPSDDPIAEYCRTNEVKVERGSECDVLDRYYRSAKAHCAEVVVRITADCPLIDPAIVDQMVQFFWSQQDSIDYVGNSEPMPGTYPDGMDVWIMSLTALEKAWLEAEKPSEREHVVFYFYNNPELFKIRRLDLDHDMSSYRFTVDYPEDIEFLRTIYQELGKRGQFGHMNELVRIVDELPELRDMKNQFQFGQGWKSAFEKDSELLSMDVSKAPPLDHSQGNELWERVIKVIPGGAQTFSKMPYQHVAGVAPKFLLRGKGCRVWDLDGNEYIDSVLGLGAILLGHCREEVCEVATEAAREYFSCPSLPHPLEYKLAVRLNELIPCSEMVRFAKNGSDVTSGAVRLSRHLTGRDLIACTGYHGWHDWYIGATGRHAGVPKVVRKLTKVFQYNDFASLEKIFKENKGNLAAVILEPVNFEPPQDDFLHKVRDLCTKEGTVLIFDEVISGFRIGLGGAQAYFGVTPDLGCFGKSIANGYPLSVLCGRAEYMKGFKEAFFSGTFGGEIVSIAAALKTLEICDRENVPQHLAQVGKPLIDGWNTMVKELPIPYSRAIGYVWWPKYTFEPCDGYTSYEILTLFQQELVKRGVLTRNTIFISNAHQPSDVRQMLAAMKKALLVIRQALAEKNLHDLLEGQIIEPVIRDENIKH